MKLELAPKIRATSAERKAGHPFPTPSEGQRVIIVARTPYWTSLCAPEEPRTVEGEYRTRSYGLTTRRQRVDLANESIPWRRVVKWTAV